MNLFSQIFNSIMIKNHPDPLTVSDWLQNLCEYLSKYGNEILANRKNSPAMLSCFALISSAKSTLNVLHFNPKTSIITGIVFREFRLYYECLWQFVLLNTNRDNKAHLNKVSCLYSSVDICTRSLLESLFEENKQLKKLLGCLLNEDYYDRLSKACRIYINRLESPDIERERNPLAANSFDLTKVLHENMRCKKILVKFEDLLSLILEETAGNINLKYFQEFDFKNCIAIELPDNHYR